MNIIRTLVERKERYQSYADELTQTGVTQKSLTDPDSRLMMANGKMDVCYNVQTAVDEKNKLNIALCPMGKVLYPGHFINRVSKAAFSNFAECYRCPCKCTKSNGIMFEIDIPKETE